MSWMRTSWSPAPRPDGPPGGVDVGHVGARLEVRNDPRIVRIARQFLQDPDRRRRQVDRAGARIPVGEADLARVEVDVFPTQREDFISATARQHQQADRRHRPLRYPAAVAQDLIQHAPQAIELRVGQEPLAFPAWVQRDGPAWIAPLRCHGPLPGKGKHMAQRSSPSCSPWRGSRRDSRADP